MTSPLVVADAYRSKNATITDTRICFGISWFTDEAKAEEYARLVRAAGITYNGGWYHGQPCGRARRFDYHPKDPGNLFAVTD
jgi:hypothetical protein